MHYYAYPYLPYPYYHPSQRVANLNLQVSPSYYGQLQTELAIDPPNPYPPVDTRKFNESAKKYQVLTKQISLFFDKVATSPQFANELMEAAQLSNSLKVEEMIRSVGITVKIKSQFTPTGMIIEVDNGETEGNCCRLRVVLPW
ncbi:hypothetical protein MHZ95_04090 [Sporosarcina sp. ACRSM]|uniref:hypothetical protein n=1 Tax=Sporosarcina sp. ACRSM TaxID=2918216 RepID=UPI001EF521F8|nr:hypothetical protein [Sporosarcina sp. ACRSM]MCG7334461.1 hypothetical protein [Sporosarcina sp. ACRSM]